VESGHHRQRKAKIQDKEGMPQNNFCAHSSRVALVLTVQPGTVIGTCP
jgi:hypothetical protein